MTLSVNELRRLTRRYWNMSGTRGHRIRWYIANLLPHELEYARSPERKAIEDRTCDTLALLVGHSIEPLLQVICAFQPKERLVLLLSEWYGSQEDPHRQSGLDRGEDLKELIEELPHDLFVQQPVIELYEVTNQPASVFRKLCQRVLPVQRAGKRVIVDITGAKKSMDAGAFLFAAYADIPVSYVNFDDYDEEKRRPYGFTCRIETLDNPYELFRLRDWERVRRLYRNYHFRSAQQELEGIIAAMGSGVQQAEEAFFVEEEIAAANHLATLLSFYERWDDGDFYWALTASPIEFPIPLAVRVLGEVWPHVETSDDVTMAAQRLLRIHDTLQLGDPDPRSSIFAKPAWLITYAYDELAKVTRLARTNEDNRSALLRAAGLNELLLKGRFTLLWLADKLVVVDRAVERLPSSFDKAEQRPIYTALVTHSGVKPMWQTLQRLPDVKLPLRIRDLRSGKRRDLSVILSSDAPTLTPYWDGCGLDPVTLADLRNRAIHLYLYVPQLVAKAAVEMARANLEDFIANWVSPDSVPTIGQHEVQAPTWAEICSCLGLTFLPLVSARKEAS